jgi:hypothetical protein
MKIEIEKNVPRPVRFPEFPFAEMAVGDSFAVPSNVSHASMRQHIQRFKVNRTERFSLLKTDNGYRCWRVK